MRSVVVILQKYIVFATLLQLIIRPVYAKIMTLLTYIVIFSLLGGLVSLVGGLVLIRKERNAKRMARYATPFAAGALLAAVFLDLLPEGLAESSTQTVLVATLSGILLFFLAERFLRWFHHHHQDDESSDEKKHDATVPMIIVGDTIHNALDGAVIAAAFLINIPTGIITTLAVAAHEIPQEIGDFGLLLHKGLSKSKVIWANVASALATTILAIITYFIGSAEHLPMGILIGVSAGFLLYIALSDIIPELHHHANEKKLFEWQPALLIIGVATVAGMIQLAGKFIAH